MSLPFWDYLWEPSGGSYRTGLPRFTGDPGEDRTVVYDFTVETTFEGGMLNLQPWEADPVDGYALILSQDDVWANYFEPIKQMASLYNTWSDEDEALGVASWYWPLNEKVKPFEVDWADERSDPPHSVEWAWLSYRFPARRLATGCTPFTIPGFEGHQYMNQPGFGVDRHSAMREYPIQDVKRYFDYIALIVKP
ncbi:MAG: hypothetical protein IT365_24255 [Candidatus Hydrogenedentes bacterium]|nr:hypothetical protein [Candidatus Hydrogenedentota bacterium]